MYVDIEGLLDFLNQVYYFFRVDFPVLRIQFPLSGNQLFEGYISAVEFAQKTYFF